MANAEVILQLIAEKDSADTYILSQQLHTDHQKIIGAVKSLESIEGLITTKPSSHKVWKLTDEGESVLRDGSYEVLLYNAIPQDGISQTQLFTMVPNAKIGFSKAMAKGWISIDKVANLVIRKVDTVVDELQNGLKKVSLNAHDVPEDAKQDYKKRKLLTEVVVKSLIVGKGDNFSTCINKLETDLTTEMLLTGSWKNAEFKPYNFDAMGVIPPNGNLHPLLKVRSEFREKFLEMGFSEMPANNYVENSFWNFDALFQPQQHPARDAHDTFFIKEPGTSNDFAESYMKKVKQVHSKGGYRSKGYRYKWSIDEAEKNLLRTHTTAVTARMLYQLAQKKEPFKPVKYFSIDRVFRNETLDATHLAEFHQVEGIICDYKLSLGNLIGVLYEFFHKLGIEKLKFKPAYNPYTEPSMEVFCYHEGLKKWIEVGNSGMFRPEMLLPMGLPKNVNVIGWGLSVERPTMVKYGIDNIRDLVGSRINVQNVYGNAICRL